MKTLMHTRMLKDAADVLQTRALAERSVIPWALVDFDELMALEAIRSRTRLWISEHGWIGAFAFVDDFNNLRIGVDPQEDFETVGAQAVGWGEESIRRKIMESGEPVTLDATCRLDAAGMIDFLRRHGFEQSEIRSLHYARTLANVPQQPALPEGFIIRSVRGEYEAQALVDLHRAAFGSDWMTVEYRLGMMRTEVYAPEIDLVIEAADGELAAFCVCSIDAVENRKDGRLDGWADPIGVHPKYQRRGFGRAILLTGLAQLKAGGMERARLGTSSENTAMQRLAQAVGFDVIEENVWFCKVVE